MSATGVPGFLPSGELDVGSVERPGAVVTPAGVRFEVWAPTARRVEVVVDPEGARRAVELDRIPGPEVATTWVATVPGIGHGTPYRYRLDGKAELADPASRHQPRGVFGPSAVVDTSLYRWNDEGWRGVQLSDLVLYELHVGTFTSEGTLTAAIGELPRLAAIGITAIELMPLAQFSGERGWGYDGVFPSAVQHSYGGPDALAAFVGAAHANGLAVVVDVVYNHFGPEGNVSHLYGPYLTDAYETPWGGAVNVAGPGSDQVRRFLVDNARLWVEDFHVDGIRVDAVHAIVDPTARSFLEELNSTVHELGRRQNRTVISILESSANDPRLVTAPPVGQGGDAVWNDDYHHSLRVALTGDRSGYYVDYRGVEDVADVLANHLAFRGRFSIARERRHGRDASHLTPCRFVVFDQNHDQIGNRRDGERLDVLVDHERRKLALAAVLLSPFTPMMFMGEEYGDPAPFPFFVDFQSEELLDAVRGGRAAEFAAFAWQGRPPDPASPGVFQSAILCPELAEQPPHRWLLDLTTTLLQLRRDHSAVSSSAASSSVTLHHRTVMVRRDLPRSTALLVLHFDDEPTSADLEGLDVVVDTSSERWGGPGAASTPTGDPHPLIRPWSAVLAVR